MAGSMVAAQVFLVLGLFSFAQGILPTALECADGITEIGIEGLTDTLTPCAFGAGKTCCNGLNPIFKLGAPSPSAGCLCSELLLDEVVNEITSNELAAAVGFDRKALEEVLQECGTNFFGGNGDAWCPPRSQRINFSPSDIEDIQRQQAAQPGPIQSVAIKIRRFFTG